MIKQDKSLFQTRSGIAANSSQHCSTIGLPQFSKNAFNPERLGSDRNRRNYNGGANGRTITRDPNVQNDRQITILDSSQMAQPNHPNGEQSSRSHRSPPPQRGRSDRAPNTQPYRNSNGHPRSDPPLPGGEDSRNLYRNNSRQSPERSIGQRDRKPIVEGSSTKMGQQSPSTSSSRQFDRNSGRHNRQRPYSRPGPDNSDRRRDRPAARDPVKRNTSPPRHNESARQESRTSSSQSSKGSQTENVLNRDGNTAAESSESKHTRRDPPVQSACDTQPREIPTAREQPPTPITDTLRFITSKSLDQDDDLDFENDDDVVTDAYIQQPDATQSEQRDSNSLDLTDASDSTGNSQKRESATEGITSPRKEPEFRGPSSPQDEEERNQRGVNHNSSTKGNQKASAPEDRKPPAPWSEHRSTRDGQIYYWNKDTDKVQYAFPGDETTNGHRSNSASSTRVSTSETEDRKRKADDERDRSTSNQRGSSSRPVQRSSGPAGKGKAREDDPATNMPAEKRPRRDYNDSRGRSDYREPRHRFSEAQPRPNAQVPLVTQEELYRQQDFDRRPPPRPSFQSRGPRPMEPPDRRRAREPSPPPASLPLGHGPNRTRSPPRTARSFQDNGRADDPRRRRDTNPIPPRYPHPRRPVDNPNDVPLPNRARLPYSSQPSSSSNNTSQDVREHRDSNRPSNRRDEVITNSRTERNDSNKDNEPAPYRQSRHRQG
ncbi:unnamed protein product [Umbelopsis ramanniana]